MHDIISFLDATSCDKIIMFMTSKSLGYHFLGSFSNGSIQHMKLNLKHFNRERPQLLKMNGSKKCPLTTLLEISSNCSFTAAELLSV